jgi:hypothetical protein
VIVDPINDVECLGQLTRIARELAPTTLVRLVARHIVDLDPRVSPRLAVVRWIQSRPQTDDDGEELARYVACDVPQRVRLLADDPNCVERSTDAMMLLEVIEPSIRRALATVVRPARHTGLVEHRDGRWHAVDLFPRRNARRNINWGELGKDVLQGAHQYIGKPVMKFYGLGSVADTLGDAENNAIGRGGKNEKKEQPSRRPGSPGGSIGAGIAATGKGWTKGGSRDGEKEAKEGGRSGAATAGGGVDRARAGQAAAGDGDHPHDSRAEAKRRWWGLG